MRNPLHILRGTMFKIRLKRWIRNVQATIAAERAAETSSDDSYQNERETSSDDSSASQSVFRRVSQDENPYQEYRVSVEVKVPVNYPDLLEYALQSPESMAQAAIAHKAHLRVCAACRKRFPEN